MTEKHKEVDRSQALETLMERAAESEKEEVLELSRNVEEGAIHPSLELLREYATGLMDEEDTLTVADHVALCGPCADKLLKIQYVENLTKFPVISWLERIKAYLSDLSFPVFVQSPALEAVRGPVSDRETSSYAPGDELIVTLRTPADGYVTIFHGCEETGEVNLIFPSEPTDNPKVFAGQEIVPIRGNVEEPAGKHFFKVFWTKDIFIDPTKIDFSSVEQIEEAKHDFFDDLEELEEADWRAATIQYTVIQDE